jgi:hypothetical protein
LIGQRHEQGGSSGACVCGHTSGERSRRATCTAQHRLGHHRQSPDAPVPASSGACDSAKSRMSIRKRAKASDAGSPCAAQHQESAQPSVDHEGQWLRPCAHGPCAVRDLPCCERRHGRRAALPRWAPRFGLPETAYPCPPQIRRTPAMMMVVVVMVVPMMTGRGWAESSTQPSMKQARRQQSREGGRIGASELGSTPAGRCGGSCHAQRPWTAAEATEAVTGNDPHSPPHRGRRSHVQLQAGRQADRQIDR